MTPKHDPDWLKAARSKGGKARAKALSGKRRSEIARHAANCRWDKYLLGKPGPLADLKHFAEM